ncbi:DUF2934 domain-containing protein [candidate division KSB1 bacterium]|nr:DUF2934 domain-containing protein [candidate division KSB1 bacterium]
MNKTTKTMTRKRQKIDPEKLAEEIRERAHEIYLARGDQEGDALSDWLQAEQEIKEKYNLP